MEVDCYVAEFGVLAVGSTDKLTKFVPSKWGSSVMEDRKPSATGIIGDFGH